MVVATTATLVVPMFWRMRENEAARTSPARRRAYALVVAALVPLAALGCYVWWGRPDLAHTRPPAADNLDIATQHARSAARGGGENGGDLGAAVERLRARLARNPDDVDGWLLLAQAYEFEGRAAEAAAARQRAGGKAVEPVAMSAPAAAALDAESTRLVGQAEEHRRLREFAKAVKDFAELERRGALNADLWADYADALGGARGKLDDEAMRCVGQALRLEPDHAKALWLQASWQTQRRDYAAALGTWQRLAEVLPGDSPDARIIAANLAEAREKLAASSSTATKTPPVAASALRGSVRLDPRLRDRVRSGDTLFVFARAADERGPPLAVLRLNAGPWPLSFELSDDNAMMPGRTLSNFKRVILEARISRSGNALAQPGDLRGVSPVLDPGNSPKQVLTIAEEVGGAPMSGGG